MSQLEPDCGNCAALCCVATAFDRSEDFGLDKPAGIACPLLEGYRCSIHGELIPRGFRGCAAYDCHGAGPRATAAFAGRAEAEEARHRAFLALRGVHELLWMLTQVVRICPESLDPGLQQELASEMDALASLSAGPVHQWGEADLDGHAATTQRLLRRVGVALGGRNRVRRALVVLGRPAPADRQASKLPTGRGRGDQAGDSI